LGTLYLEFSRDLEGGTERRGVGISKPVYISKKHHPASFRFLEGKKLFLKAAPVSLGGMWGVEVIRMKRNWAMAGWS
jgi:hypothetical protein